MTSAGPSAAPKIFGPRVLLLVPARTYRATDFLLAAGRMGLDLVIGSDGALSLGGRPVIPVRPDDLDGSVRRLADRAAPVAAVVAADTPMLELAALAAEKLGLPHNPVEAVRDAGDKARQRERWAAAGVAQPRFEIVPGSGGARDAVGKAAAAVGFPCVVKAISLSASQGILRADDPDQAQAAAGRIRRVLAAAGHPDTEPLLVEEYLPGPELSIDGLLGESGDLSVTALFDKPATPDGPTFEETLLVAPSELPALVRAEAIATAGRAARALGLVSGPIHAELRIASADGQARPAGGGGQHGRAADGNRSPVPTMVELAGRSIGGLCSRALRFPGGATLEELVLANALGRPAPAISPDPPRPCGVFMLPVPRPGVLRAIEGRDRAVAVPGITGLSITIPIGQRVLPLPDGDRYLGFLFAEAGTRRGVEQALTTACRQLRVDIA